MCSCRLSFKAAPKRAPEWRAITGCKYICCQVLTTNLEELNSMPACLLLKVTFCSVLFKGSLKENRHTTCLFWGGLLETDTHVFAFFSQDVYFADCTLRFERVDFVAVARIDRSLSQSVTEKGRQGLHNCNCGWLRNPFRTTLEILDDTIRLQVSTNNCFPWFQSSAGFHPFTVWNSKSAMHKCQWF